MAILGNHGILLVDAIPTHTPAAGQATLARLQNTNKYYYYDGTQWVEDGRIYIDTATYQLDNANSGKEHVFRFAGDVEVTLPAVAVDDTEWLLTDYDSLGDVKLIDAVTNVEGDSVTVQTKGPGESMWVRRYGAPINAYKVSGAVESTAAPINFFQEGDGTETNPTANIANAIAQGLPVAVTDGAGTITQLFDPVTLAGLEAWAVATYGAGTTVSPTTYEITPANGATANVVGFFDPTIANNKVSTIVTNETRLAVEVVVDSQYTIDYVSGNKTTMDINLNGGTWLQTFIDDEVTYTNTSAVTQTFTVDYTLDASSQNAAANGSLPKTDSFRAVMLLNDDPLNSINAPAPSAGSTRNPSPNTIDNDPDFDFDTVAGGQSFNVQYRYFNNPLTPQNNTMIGTVAAGKTVTFLTQSRVKYAVVAVYLNGGATFISAEDQVGTALTELQFEDF